MTMSLSTVIYNLKKGEKRMLVTKTSFLIFISVVFLSSCSNKQNEIDNNEIDNIFQPKNKITTVDQINSGQKIYLQRCATCHQRGGQGIKEIYPPLANSDWLKKDVKIHAISSIKNGKKGLITVNGVNYNGVMPAQMLSDQEIANVLTYIYQSLNGLKATVSESEVQSVNENTFSGMK